MVRLRREIREEPDAAEEEPVDGGAVVGPDLRGRIVRDAARDERVVVLAEERLALRGALTR